MRHVGWFVIAVGISRLLFCAEPHGTTKQASPRENSEVVSSPVSAYREKLSQCQGDTFAAKLIPLLDFYEKGKSQAALDQLKKIIGKKTESRPVKNLEFQKAEQAFLKFLDSTQKDPQESDGSSELQPLALAAEESLKDPKAGTCPSISPQPAQKFSPDSLKDLKGTDAPGAAEKSSGAEGFERRPPELKGIGSGLDGIGGLLAGVRPQTENGKKDSGDNASSKSSGGQQSPPPGANGPSQEDNPSKPTPADSHGDSKKKNSPQDGGGGVGGGQPQNFGNGGNTQPKEEKKSPPQSSGSSERSRPEPTPDPKAKERAEALKDMNEEMQKQVQMQKEMQNSQQNQNPAFQPKAPPSIPRTSAPRPVSQNKPEPSTGGLRVK